MGTRQTAKTHGEVVYHYVSQFVVTCVVTGNNVNKLSKSCFENTSIHGGLLDTVSGRPKIQLCKHCKRGNQKPLSKGITVTNLDEHKQQSRCDLDGNSQAELEGNITLGAHA